MRSRIANCGLYSVERFASGAFGEADHPEGRGTASNIHLYLDRESINPGKGARKYTGKQIRYTRSARRGFTPVRWISYGESPSQEIILHIKAQVGGE